MTAREKQPCVLCFLDHRWLAAKLSATEPNAAARDFNLLNHRFGRTPRLLRDALRLSGHVLARHPEELSSQLAGPPPRRA